MRLVTLVKNNYTLEKDFWKL